MFFLYSARTENDRKDKRTPSVFSSDQSVENTKCLDSVMENVNVRY